MKYWQVRGHSALYGEFLHTHLSRCNSLKVTHLCVKSKTHYADNLNVWMCYTSLTGFREAVVDMWKEVNTLSFMWTISGKDQGRLLPAPALNDKHTLNKAFISLH